MMTLAFLLLAVLIILLLVRIPIALAMTLASMVFLYLMAKAPMIIVPQRLWGGLESFPLLAIPFFVLAGSLMNRSGGAERIFTFCLSILGHIRGGLGHVNVLASMIFAGMSGAATADAAGLGAIEIEAMRRDGYKLDFSAAVTAASSTIGPIIPPSVPLVVYGVMAQVSVGQLFLGGFLPGILMGFTMMGVVAIKARKENYPTHPRASFQTVRREFLSSSLSLLAPIIILGGIFSGAFTPTEAGVVASVYALRPRICLWDDQAQGPPGDLRGSDAHNGPDYLYRRCGWTFWLDHYSCANTGRPLPVFLTALTNNQVHRFTFGQPCHDLHGLFHRCTGVAHYDDAGRGSLGNGF